MRTITIDLDNVEDHVVRLILDFDVEAYADDFVQHGDDAHYEPSPTERILMADVLHAARTDFLKTLRDLTEGAPTAITEGLLEKARALMESVHHDTSGINGQGGNGGLISTATIRRADELHQVILRLETPHV